MSFASVFSRPFSARGLSRLPALIVAAAFVLPASLLRAQDAPGTLDPDFTSALVGSSVYALVYQYIPGTDINIPDNELIFAAGDLAIADDLIEDGHVYMGYNPIPFGNDVSREIYVAVQEKFPQPLGAPPYLLVGGLFGKSTDKTLMNNPAANIARLLPNGLQDATFDVGKGADDFVTAILPFVDGRIVVGGEFESFNKESHNHIVRLEYDGSIDESFANKLQIDDDILNMDYQVDPATGQPNGSIIICGVFNSVGGQSVTKVARLDTNGNLDTTFKPVIDTRVDTVSVQPDGKILIGGDFATVNGAAVSRLARLNYDGSLDTTFVGGVSGVPTGEVNPCAVYVLRPLGDGRVYVGGNFTQYSGTSRLYLARIFEDGTLDPNFDPGSTIINKVQSIALQDDRKVLVGETLSRTVNDVYPPSLIRLFGDPPGPPEVTIDAFHAVAKEEGGTPDSVKDGKFRINRTVGNVTGNLQVYIDVGGTADLSMEDHNGAYKFNNVLTIVDRAKGIYSLTLPGDEPFVTLKVRPTREVQVTSPTTITVTLDPNQSFIDGIYTIGAESSATVFLYNH